MHDPEPDLDNANVGMLAGLFFYMIIRAASGIGRRFFMLQEMWRKRERDAKGIIRCYKRKKANDPYDY